MPRQIALSDAARAPELWDGHVGELLPDVAYQRQVMVNVVYYGERGAGDRQWVLVDAGLKSSAPLIVEAAERRFGPQVRPAAIVLTHGHFDHVGSLRELAELWDAPIYAHPAELPYLDGRMAYPPADPGVGGGSMAALAWTYPRGPIDVSQWLEPLNSEEVPFMPGWQWIHTPGHTPGHISLWREEDRTLIAGDAFITTRQESALAVMTQWPEMHGPPMYFTPDWDAAADSVRRLAQLQPELAITGHGLPMSGPALRQALARLASQFRRVAVPRHGRYTPTIDPAWAASDEGSNRLANTYPR